MTAYEGKRVLVVGLGESGRAAARFFAARGARVTAADVRPAAELAAVADELAGLGVALRLGGHGDSLFLEQDLIVPSPGVRWDLPALAAARRAGVETAGELEVAEDVLRGARIGVTGSNGKTTTTSLIGHILETAARKTVVAGNIGTPLLAVADESTDDQWSVLELSSFQLEAMRSFRCEIALVLNVTPDHLDRHGTFEAYAAAKARLLGAQEPGDLAVLNADDPTCVAFGAQARGRVAWFSRTLEKVEAGAWVAGDRILLDGREIFVGPLPIKGSHNLENALAAIVAADAAGVADADIAHGLKTFQPVEHRLEFVDEIDGVAYYNDSKATNVDAALKAIQAFDSGLWTILGGRDKGSDYRPLIEPLAARGRETLLIGEAAPLIREQVGGRLALRDCGTLGDALEYARDQARPGDTVLLAPACASFDQFTSYGHRGREFKRLVGELAGRVA